MLGHSRCHKDMTYNNSVFVFFAVGGEIFGGFVATGGSALGGAGD